MKKRVFILVLLIAVAGLLAYGVSRSGRTAEDQKTFHGNVDIREVNLGFRVSGKIQAVLRDEGDAVQPGEVLARIDPEPYQRELEAAQAQEQSTQARLSLLEAGYRPQEIAQAEALVNERAAAVTNAVRFAARQRELTSNKTISEQEFEDAEARAREAQARLVSAEKQLALLRSGYREEEIKQARAEQERAHAAVASAKLRLADTELKASESGVVLTRAQEPGAVIQAGTTILTVSLRAPVWVRAYVNEPQLGTIQPGIKVSVFTDSRPGKPYRGQVGYVSPRAEFTPKNVETPDLRTSLVYRFRVVVEDPDDSLRQGMPVTVKIGSGAEPRSP